MNTKPNKTKYILPTLLAAIILVIALVPATSSCGHDEPPMLVGYYMDIQSEVMFKASEDDEQQGTMSDQHNVLYNTIMRMKAALQEAYPINDYTGNDAAVIAALDAIYHEYKAAYGHLEKKTICVIKLYRTRVDGTIIKGSRSLKVYHFGALPPNIDQIE